MRLTSASCANNSTFSVNPLFTKAEDHPRAMAKPSVQLINPKDFGRRTIEMPVFDAQSVARADQALKALSGSFQEWLEADVALLQAARVAGEQGGWNAATFDAVLGAAHDLKGLGATYEYPLATKIAASLCRLLEAERVEARPEGLASRPPYRGSRAKAAWAHRI